MLKLTLPDLSATEALGQRLASLLRPGDTILLEGALGAGKTALARALLRAAANDPALEVPSPSFTLLQTYDTPIGLISHYDLWRVDQSADVTELDWDEARDGVVLVEWPDRLGPLRPPDALTITLELAVGELAMGELAVGELAVGEMAEEEARTAVVSGWPDRIERLK